MYNLDQAAVRNFFFALYAKAANKEPLSDLEKMAYSVILEHPEYTHVLQDKTKYFDYNWAVDRGETNPFLHLAMHLSILEQLSINQPNGITDLFHKLCVKFGNKHDATHHLIDCLAEMIWTMQKNNTEPDSKIYFACIDKKLGIEKE